MGLYALHLNKLDRYILGHMILMHFLESISRMQTRLKRVVGFIWRQFIIVIDAKVKKCSLPRLVSALNSYDGKLVET